MDILLHKNVNNFFQELLSDLECRNETQAYIINICQQYKSSRFDLSKDSVTLLFAQARNKQDFFTYQNLGDWLFYIKSVFPEYINISENYYNNIAKLSYYNCYRIIKTWKTYEELADSYVSLTEQVKNRFEKIKNQTFEDIYF